MRYYPQAASPYAPPIRGLVYHIDPHPPRHTLSKRNGIIALYFILKFWDTKLVQKVLKQLISQWNMACKENQLLKRVVHSKLGDVTEKAGKNVAYYLVRCLMNITQYSGAEKVGILSIPHDIQAWAAAHGEKWRTRAKTADGTNDEVDSDPILFASNSDALREHIQRDLK